MNTWMPVTNAPSFMVQDIQQQQLQFMQSMSFNPNHVEQLLSQYKQLQQQQQQAYIEQMKAANYAARKLCFNFLRGTCTLSMEECEYRHPSSQEEVDAERAKLGKIECRYGDDCVADNCLYKHNNKKFFMFSSNATTSTNSSSKSLNSNSNSSTSSSSSVSAMVSPTNISCSRQPKRSSSPTFSAVSSISTSTSSLSRKDSIDSLSPSISSNENDLDHYASASSDINVDAMQINDQDDDSLLVDELNAFASHLSLMKELSSQYNLSAIRDPQVKTLMSVLGNIDGLGIAEKIDIPQCVVNSIETRPKIIDESITSNVDYSKLFDMVNMKRTLSYVFDLHLQQTCNYSILVSQILDYVNYHQLDYAWIMVPKGDKQEMELETILFDKNIDYMVGASNTKPGQLGYLIRII